MMTYKVGAASGRTAGRDAAAYYIEDTVRTETIRPAEYYAGRAERAADFWQKQVLDEHVESARHRVELRPDLSPALAERLGLGDGAPITEERLTHLLSLRRADGGEIPGRQIHRAKADGKKPPIGWIDLTFSASKSLSVAWGLAPTAEERHKIHNVHRNAVSKTMLFVAEEIGFTQRGGRKNRRIEAGDIAYLKVDHFTSRPTPDMSADMNIHSHVLVLPHVLTESGHLGALDLDHLNGKVKLFGSVYEAYVAAEARKLGIRVHFDEKRATTQLSDIPATINELFSKRSQQAHAKAQEIASTLGVDWDAISEDGRNKLIEAGVRQSRRSKEDEKNDFASWSEQADEAGYRYSTVLGQVEVRQEAPPAPAPQPIDELSQNLLETITTALRYTHPDDQSERLIWEMGWIVLHYEKMGTPTPRLAQDLMRAITGALSTDTPEEALIAGTGEAIRQYEARIQAHQERMAEDRARSQLAYDIALPRLQDEWRRRAVLDENELRRVAAQAYVVAGIKDAGSDIDAVMHSFRRDGVVHEGQRVSLVSQEAASVRGKRRVRMTTGLHIAHERELIRLAKAAADDTSAALPPEKVDRAVLAFLRSHRAIDAAGDHWQAQRGMIDHLASGGRLSVVIGVPGSGKSASLAPLVQAWRDEGRAVYGISLAWRQASDLENAGIGERASIAAFIKRVETGRYDLDRNSVVIVDEVGLVGSRQMLDLLRIRERTGAQLIMIGDPRQNQPIEGSSGLELLREALGEEAIPRLLYSVRQSSEREREIGALFRRGMAAEALEMKREDGTALLVQGGREETMRRIAKLWHERVMLHRRDPNFTITISTPTNADARDIGAAIREERRKMGELGGDVQTIRATDRTGQTYDLPLATGDRVRLFDRVYDNQRKRIIGNNGDVVEVRQFLPDGLVVRDRDGHEGSLLWAKIRANPDAPVRLAWGYALTVDTAQGSTATEHIHALPSGSAATHGLKTYTAATRHRTNNWLVIDEASERQQLADRMMIGYQREILEDDVWAHVGESLSRHPLKPSALSVQRQATQPSQRAAA